MITAQGSDKKGERKWIMLGLTPQDVEAFGQHLAEIRGEDFGVPGVSIALVVADTEEGAKRKITSWLENDDCSYVVALEEPNDAWVSPELQGEVGSCKN